MEEALSQGEERFDRWRHRAGFWLAPLAFLLAYALTRSRLTAEGSHLSAVLASVLVLWMTESVPLPVTAVLGAGLSVLFGVADVKTVLAPFADPIVFLFMGSFILAKAMELHRLDQRFALAILSWPWVGGKPLRVLVAIGLATAVLSMWVSNTATAAMMLPIGLGLLQALGDIGPTEAGASIDRVAVRRSPYGTGMMLMVAYAASVGGIGTPVGSPPNLIGIGMLRKLAGVNITLFQWMALCLPILLVTLAVLFFLLCWLHPSKSGNHPEHAAGDFAVYVHQHREALGSWTRGQINTLAAFGTAVLLWIGPGVLAVVVGKEHATVKFLESHLPESVVALVAAALLFVLPTDAKRPRFTLTWQEAVQIDWGTILLFGGGLSLGGLMFSTGVAEAFGRWVVSLTGAESVWALTAVAIVVAILVTETTSNTASANMILPVIIALAQSAHLNPVPPAVGACLGASYAFVLPVSTPPNAIVYGSGLVSILKMARAGLLLDLCGLIIILLGLRVLCPLLGLA